MADRFYTVISPTGTELSIAVTPTVFKKQWEASGHVLGFATDGNREPYSDDTLKALEKGRRALEQDARARGLPTFIGPEVPTPNEIVAPEAPKAKAESKAKAEA